jgi:hypothetical protein
MIDCTPNSLFFSLFSLQPKCVYRVQLDVTLTLNQMEAIDYEDWVRRQRAEQCEQPEKNMTTFAPLLDSKSMALVTYSE